MPVSIFKQSHQMQEYQLKYQILELLQLSSQESSRIITTPSTIINLLRLESSLQASTVALDKGINIPLVDMSLNQCDTYCHMVWDHSAPWGQGKYKLAEIADREIAKSPTGPYSGPI